MQFRYTILYVPDVRQTLAFYEKAFACETAFLHEEGDYGELATGTTKLAFSSIDLMTKLGKSPANTADKKALKQPVFEIAFETDDVADALEAALQAGCSLVQDVEAMPWGQTVAYVTDLNGFLVELCSPVI